MPTNDSIKKTFKRFVPLNNREPIRWEGVLGSTALLTVGLLTRGVAGSLFTLIGGYSLAQQARKIDAVEKALERPKQRLKTISGDLQNLGESTRSVCIARKVDEIKEFLANPASVQKYYPSCKCELLDNGKWGISLTNVDLPKQLVVDFQRSTQGFEWTLKSIDNKGDDNASDKGSNGSIDADGGEHKQIKLTIGIEELPRKAMTKITATLHCPPAVGLLTPLGKIIGKDPGSQLERALMTTKQFLETGEVATSKNRGKE